VTGRCEWSWRETSSWRVTLRRLPSRASQARLPTSNDLPSVMTTYEGNSPRATIGRGMRQRRICRLRVTA
jgi:hypothetical protein